MADATIRLTAQDSGVKQTFQQAAAAAADFAKEIGATGKGVMSMNGALKTAKKAVSDLTMAYAQLSDEAKSSDFGKNLKEQLDEAKKAAADLVDMKGDIATELKNMASDTAGWDAMKEGIGAVGSAGTALVGIMSSLGGESATAAETLKIMATVQSTVNAVITIGNALQGQSAVMTGVNKIQTAALAKAKEMEAAATGKATVAQRLFNAVAKANPYVLLATAAIAVGTALAVFASHSAEAKKKEEEFQKTVEQSKQLNEAYAQAVSDNYVEMAAKVDMLTESCKKENKTQQEKNQIYESAKPIFEEIGIKVSNYNDVENQLINNGSKIYDSLLERAKAMAAYRIAITRADLAIQDLMKTESNIRQMAQYVGQTKTLSQWKELNIDQKYLKRKPGPKQTRINARTGEVIEFEGVTDEWVLSQEAYDRAYNDMRVQQEKEVERINKQLAKDLADAMKNDAAYNAIIGRPSGTKTPKTSKKSTNEAETAVAKINKLLDEEKKKLENINKENDKDGTKKKAIYRTMRNLLKNKEKYYAVDNSGFEEKKNILQDILSLSEDIGDEIEDAKREIRGINGQRILQLMEKGKDGLADALKLLEENRDMVKEGTDEYDNYTGMIEKVKKAMEDMNFNYQVGQLGRIAEDISQLQEKMNNTYIFDDKGIEELLALVNKIAELTGQQAVIDIMINQSSVDEFISRWAQLKKKFGLEVGNESDSEFEGPFKKAILADAQNQLSALHEELNAGSIDIYKFAQEYEKLIKFVGQNGIPTKELNDSLDSFIKSYVDSIVGGVKNATGMVAARNTLQDLVDSKALKDLFGRDKGLIDGREYFEAIRQMGLNALGDLQQQYDEGWIDKKKFKAQVEELKKILKELGVEIELTPQINQPKWRAAIDESISALGSLGDAMSSLAQAQEDEGLAVAGIITKAIANVALGAATASAKAAETGNPWVWLGFSAAAMAEMAAMIASIHSATGMATGGIVDGPTTQGDMLLTRLNRGEMVLNDRQQSNLFKLLDSGAVGGSNVQVGGTVKIKGSDLYLALKNYGKVTNKKL